MTSGFGVCNGQVGSGSPFERVGCFIIEGTMLYFDIEGFLPISRKVSTLT